MPPTTNGLRVPALADTPDVPRDIGNLAADVEAYVGVKRPYCRVHRQASQVIPADSVWLIVPFTHERYDPAGMHSTSVNPSRVVIARPGVYAVSFSAYISTPQAGENVAVMLRVNGNTFIAASNHPAFGDALIGDQLNVATEWKFATNDYVEAVAVNGASVPATLLAGDAYSPELAVSMLTPA